MSLSGLFIHLRHLPLKSVRRKLSGRTSKSEHRRGRGPPWVIMVKK